MKFILNFKKQTFTKATYGSLCIICTSFDPNCLKCTAVRNLQKITK